jgi:shikimate dehydrogenase
MAAHPNRFHLAGVMGIPVLHSRSPRLHGYWMNLHGMTGAYLPLEIASEKLGAALRALPALGFAGCNLTIPHKIAALDLVDHVDESVRRVGAINCVVVRPDGSLTGRNYDGFGFVESLTQAAPDWRADDGPALVLGAGGAARAVLFGLLERGARRVMIANRSRERADALAREFGVEAIDWADRSAALAQTATLVNTTSLGMVGQPALEIDLTGLSSRTLVSDIVYTPLETPLLAAARAKGCRAVDGLGMLIHQARPAFRDWFGVMPEATPQLRKIIEATL